MLNFVLNHISCANRKAVRQFYQAGSEFTLGKGNVVKEGKDVCIIACGQLVNDAMDAALDLEEKGISCEVIDMFTMKARKAHFFRCGMDSAKYLK